MALKMKKPGRISDLAPGEDDETSLFNRRARAERKRRKLNPFAQARVERSKGKAPLRKNFAETLREEGKMPKRKTPKIEREMDVARRGRSGRNA